MVTVVTKIAESPSSNTLILQVHTFYNNIILDVDCSIVNTSQEPFLCVTAWMYCIISTIVASSPAQRAWE